MTLTVLEMPPVPTETRDRILVASRTAENHRGFLAETDAMNVVQVGGEASVTRLPAQFGIAAWNVERCLFPEKTGERLKPFDPKIVLLSEVDNGMSRTGQRNTSADMARTLGMQFAYGVEFFEMGLGDQTELAYCKDDFNALGFHGNAILSSAPLEKVKLIRLDDRGHWFLPETNPGALKQPRMGERMAVAAIVQTEAGPICVVSTHLESNAQTAHRHAQFELLLNEVEAFAPNLPIIVGGDLNTGNHIPPDYDWREETLFQMAEARGYSWSLSPQGITTRRSLITPHETRKMRLDWFCVKGFDGEEGQLIAALDPEGVPLSDHECIFAEVSVAPG